MCSIGIDLGSSLSIGFYCEGKKKIHCEEIKSKEAQSGGVPENEEYHPSIVIYDETDGSVILGQKAKVLANHYPKSAIYDFKRLIGRGYDDPDVRGFKKILEERGHYELCAGDEGDGENKKWRGSCCYYGGEWHALYASIKKSRRGIDRNINKKYARVEFTALCC